ncbi:MAG: DUF58 domain-containing protein [Clostridiales bacterium]|nr:DUF58 domain-containing protein [Clostridiales bacterium]
MKRNKSGRPGRKKRAAKKRHGSKFAYRAETDRAYLKSLAVKSAFLLILLLLTLIPAAYVGNDYGYIPLLAVIFAVVISLVYALLLKRFISYVEISELSNCVRGTEMDFVVEVKNRSFLVFPKLEAFFYISDIFGGVDSVTSASLTMAPFEKREFRFTINFAHIGTYSAGLKKIHVHDLFNFFRFTIHNDRRYKIDVNPRVHPYLDLDIDKTALHESLQSWIVSPLSGMDYTGVREYVFGDPIKRIHWKISARFRTYMTKILESYGASGINVFIDLVSPEYDPETMMGVFDGVVEAGLSICCFAKSNGMEYDLIYYDKDGRKRRYAPPEFYNTMDLVAELPRITTDTESYNVNRLLVDEGNSPYAKSNIALCTANVTEEVIETLLLAKKSGRNVILFYVLPDNVYDDERAALLRPLKRLEGAKIAYYVISSVEELRRAG